MTVDSPARPGRRSPWRILGVVFAALVILVGVLTAASFMTWRTQTQDQVYPGPVQRIELNVGTGDVLIRAAAGTDVSVHRKLSWSLKKPTIRETVDGQTLRISEDCPGVNFGPGCGVNYTIGVPPEVTLVIKSSTGDVTVQGIHGTIDASTSTGDVKISDATAKLTMHSSTGDVTGTGLASSDVQAQDSTGDVRLTFTTAPNTVDARTSTGDVTITVPNGDAYNVNTTTSTGDRNVRVTQGGGATRSITAQASTGDVTVRYG
jgi:hypothetical protein